MGKFLSSLKPGDGGDPCRKLKRNLHVLSLLAQSCLSLGTPVPPPGFVRHGPSPGAVVLGDRLLAVQAVHHAAPSKLAVTVGDHLDLPLLYPEATLGAEPSAAPPLPLRQVLAALQAFPPLRAMQAQAGIAHAVVGRIFQEDQLCGQHVAEGLHCGPAAVSTVPGSHPPLVHLQLLGLVIFDFQIIPDFSKLGELEPTGLDAAAARYPMALASPLHHFFHGLG